MRIVAGLVLLIAVPAAASTLSDAQQRLLEQSVSAAAKAEIEDKKLPSLALAISDRDGKVWSAAWGFADADRKIAATPATLYRVGSINKTFTDVAVMQLVEQGKLDLDTPVERYLPDFRPTNPYGVAVTLRQLMAHRSGLVREPPVGGYFDGSAPDLARTVASLNDTRLVARPGSVVKYSNAGLAVVGRVLEVVTGTPYATLLRDRVLQPAGLAESGVTLPAPLAYAELAAYDGPRVKAPSFDIGIAPAGALYASADGMGRFVTRLLRGGDGLVARTSFDEMARAQLGLVRGTFEGHTMLSHNGGFYGYSSEMRLLPDDGVGVTVLGAVDDGATPARLAAYALRVLLALQQDKPVPIYARTTAPDDATRKRVAGWYANGTTSVVLRDLEGALLLDAPKVAAELRRDGAGFRLDDAQHYAGGIEIDPAGRWLKLDGTTYRRGTWQRPQPPAADIASLVGEYGEDWQYVRVYERDGRPYVRIDWTGYEPMRRVARDVWAFADDSPFRGEQLVFRRDETGKGVAVTLNGFMFRRREFGLEADARARELIKVNETLRAAAKAATPPAEAGTFRAPDLVPVTIADPAIRLDVRYATTDNFVGTPVYERPDAFLQRPAAEALAQVDADLKPYGFGLTVHDGYRPWYVTKLFWDATPEEGKIFTADPSKGSRHNRGAAVDLTMHERSTGRIVEMPGYYDEMSSRSYPHYVGGTSLQRWRRDLLRTAMERRGFDVYPYEWWHFDHRSWSNYAIQNVDFATLEKR